MLDVVVASDESWVRAEVSAVLSSQPDIEIHEITAGSSVLWAVHEYDPELVIVDLQIGNMGGMAACMELRLEEGADRIAHVPVLMPGAPMDIYPPSSASRAGRSLGRPSVTAGPWTRP